MVLTNAGGQIDVAGAMLASKSAGVEVLSPAAVFDFGSDGTIAGNDMPPGGHHLPDLKVRRIERGHQHRVTEINGLIFSLVETTDMT